MKLLALLPLLLTGCYAVDTTAPRVISSALPSGHTLTITPGRGRITTSGPVTMVLSGDSVILTTDTPAIVTITY